MATNNPEPKPKKAPRINRFAIGVNVLIQLALVFFILAAVNYYRVQAFQALGFLARPEVRALRPDEAVARRACKSR